MLGVMIRLDEVPNVIFISGRRFEYDLYGNEKILKARQLFLYP